MGWAFKPAILYRLPIGYVSFVEVFDDSSIRLDVCFFSSSLVVKSSRLRKPYVSTFFHAVLIWVLISTTRLKRKIGGGFKCFLFSPPIPGEMVQFD